MPAAGVNQRVPVLGAVDYASGEVVRTTPAAKTGETFVALLERVAERWPDALVVLVLDNVSYHRGAVMRVWWRTQQERVWRWLKQALAYHRFWADAAALRETAADLLGHVTTRFHPVEGPAIRLDQNSRQPA